MKAVAMRTPVPKCLDRKRKRCGIGSLGNRRAMTGKEHASSVNGVLGICDVLTQGAEGENEEQCEDVRPSVIAPSVARRSTRRLLVAILPSLQFCAKSLQ